MEAITKVYILPDSNTLPTTGSTQNLTSGQFGVYLPTYAPATAGNVASAKYIYLDQGRNVSLPGVGTNISDKIYAAKVKRWEKVTAENNINVEIVEIDDFSAQCSEDVTISLRIRTFNSNVAFYNGLLKSYTITTPCCGCGDNPCDDVPDEDLIDQFVALINADTQVTNWVTAEKYNTGSGFALRLVAKQIAPDPILPDPHAYPYQYDRVQFWAWAYHGPETSNDYNVWDNCDPFATVNYLQQGTYPMGSSAEIKQLERNYWSYSVPQIAKRLFRDVAFNGGYTSMVTDGVFYDTFYIQFDAKSDDITYSDVVVEDVTIIIAVPTGQGTGLQAILEAFLGTVTDETGTNISTTTTTSTTTV